MHDQNLSEMLNCVVQNFKIHINLEREKMIKFELENKFLQLSTEVEVSANSLAATSEVIIKAIAKEMKRKRSVFEPIFCSGKTYVLKNWFLEG